VKLPQFGNLGAQPGRSHTWGRHGRPPLPGPVRLPLLAAHQHCFVLALDPNSIRLVRRDRVRFDELALDVPAADGAGAAGPPTRPRLPGQPRRNRQRRRNPPRRRRPPRGSRRDDLLLCRPAQISLCGRSADPSCTRPRTFRPRASSRSCRSSRCAGEGVRRWGAEAVAIYRGGLLHPSGPGMSSPRWIP
jgi:hypothetical protein